MIQGGVVCLIRFVKVHGLKLQKHTQEIALIPGLVGHVPVLLRVYVKRT